MFERDYVLRMFSMLGRALARILFFRETKSYDAALLEVDNAAMSLLGLNTGTIERLPAAGLKDVLGTDPAMLQSRMYTAGVLLKEKAAILEMKGEEDESPRLYAKALRLMTEDVRGIEELDGDKAVAAVDAVFEKLRDYDLPADLKTRLIGYFEYTRRFDMAEDLIFEMVEQDHTVVPQAIEFYERLAAMSDAQLENGNLPRSEVNDALEQLRGKMPRTEER